MEGWKNLPGCMYYPNWCVDELKMSPEKLYAALGEIEVADRSSKWMKYRGHSLRRSKYFFVNDLDKRVPVYLYPGFQYASIVEEYRLIQDNPVIQRISQLVDTDINHVIGTLYQVYI